jgi:uncharacterized protein (DUF4415 family)
VAVFAGEYYCHYPPRRGETRWLAIRSVGGVEIAVAFTLRGEHITRISAQEALRRIERGESLTDSARVRAMSDDEVEAAAAADPDWQNVDPDWVEQAEPVSPDRKRRLTLALDEDVIDWFCAQDRHYRARINAILRAYMTRHRA